VLIDRFGNALLCDFGLSRIRHEVTRTFTIIREGGRPRFLAPELSIGEEKFRTSPASDIFSLSMTFLSIWTREVPFAELPNSRKVEAAIRKGRRPEKPADDIDLPPEMEQEFWLLLTEMWSHDAASRPPSHDVQSRLETIFALLLEQRKPNDHAEPHHGIS
jgi:serine/threonine protein kinase